MIVRADDDAGRVAVAGFEVDESGESDVDGADNERERVDSVDCSSGREVWERRERVRGGWVGWEGVGGR